jgi:hypothetical protein
MDLRAAEQLNGAAWNCAKLGAFLCFLIAGALFIASLFVPPPPHVANLQSNAQTPVSGSFAARTP